MNKSLNLFYIGAIFLLLSLSGCVFKKVDSIESTSEVEKLTRSSDVKKLPNIVFILVDDLGIGQVGAYRKNKISTPNIDTLAKQGLKFSQAYAGNTVCSPSRIALFTGRDGRLLHSINNDIKLRKHDYTIAKVLKQAGYDTRLIGKYGIGDTIGENDPITMGFDHWYGFMGNLEAHRHFPRYMYRDNNKFDIPENFDKHAPGRKLAHDLFTQEAVRYIREVKNKPFFLFLSYTYPHAELAAPKDTLKQYEGRFDEIPYAGMSLGKPIDRFARYYPEPVKNPRATLAAMISAIDRDVGVIANELEVNGLEENTLVIFSSDNGPHHEGGADPVFFEASAPYRGKKRDLYDGGIHTPFIVKWPAKIRANTINNNPIGFFDILPTFADIAGVDLKNQSNAQYSGVSILNTMESNTPLADRKMYWAFRGKLGNEVSSQTFQAVRQGKWKGVRYGKENPVELYDLSLDPGEANNLAEQNPSIVADFTFFFDKQNPP